MLVTVDPDDPDVRLLLATKSNISRLAPTLRFKLVAEQDDDPPKISWLSGRDDRTADDVLAALRLKEQDNPADAEAELSKLDRAVAIVRECLGDGWLAVPELERLTRQQDVSDRTLKRAKEKLDLQYRREGFGRGSHMACALPGIPYGAIHRAMGQYGGLPAEMHANAVDGQRDSDGLHTSPMHTRPSKNSAPWPSTEIGPETEPA